METTIQRPRKPMQPKPNWIKMRPPAGENYVKIREMLKELNLATVCQEARCPNVAECWGGGTATVMLMGEVCTRGCRFCSVKSGNPKGVIDSDEPYKVGFAVAQMNLDYIVLTSVDRDDLEDFGSSHFAETVEVIKANNPRIIVEVLTPDFGGVEAYIDKIVNAKPEVIAQNLETVERLTRKVRDRRAGYKKTLDFLDYVKKSDPSRYTKTSLMLGLGETDDEVKSALTDLRNVGCDVVTFGQYLQPTPRQLKVEEFVQPEKFDEWATIAKSMGFLYVASGPLVRSSYKAGEFFMKGIIEKERSLNGN